ncbi:hypothetical protein [Lentzea kentuckyensis]|uniref:hypothetical protein n=1 Tax=Lentzea kentuckyensis TaxID=360086 RepID=UPI000A38043E|nr:hypothetical protein [Lentzea kentuckyensis]
MTAPAQEEDLNKCFDGLEDKARGCADSFNKAVHHINDWRYLLGPAMLVIRPALDKIREYMDKVFKLIRTAVDHQLPVISLIRQSFAWLREVQQPVNNLVHAKTHLAYEWEGEASQAYQDKVGVQNDAIVTVGTKADMVSKWLMDIAKYNVEYMVNLAQLATDFLGALVGAAVEAATVVEIPFAVDALAGAIGDLVGKYLGMLVAIANRFMEALSKVRDLMSQMSDPKFKNGTWPQAVTG